MKANGKAIGPGGDLIHTGKDVHGIHLQSEYWGKVMAFYSYLYIQGLQQAILYYIYYFVFNKYLLSDH